jgi:hypothetical protein
MMRTEEMGTLGPCCYPGDSLTGLWNVHLQSSATFNSLPAESTTK